MVLFFGNKERELLKSKLMILLHYADLLYYKENGVSMSGMKYVRAPYGPSPENYDILLGKMTADHVVTVDIKTEDGYEKHEVLAESSVPRNVLTKKESWNVCIRNSVNSVQKKSLTSPTNKNHMHRRSPGSISPMPMQVIFTSKMIQCE